MSVNNQRRQPTDGCTGRRTDRDVSNSAKQQTARSAPGIFDGDCMDKHGVQSFVLPSRPAYATSARVHELRSRLSRRDFDIIQTLGSVVVASSAQLETLHFDQLKSTSRSRKRSQVLRRLCELGVLARLPRRIGGMRAGSASYIFALDLVGQRLLGRTKTRRPPTHTWPYLQHALLVTDLYVAAVSAERDGRLELRRFVPEPQCWNLIEGELSLRPDAIVSVKPRVGDWIDHWAVEVDRATERPIRLRDKLLQYYEAYQAGGTLQGTQLFPKVLLSVPHENRLDECLRVIERLPLEAAELIVPVLHRNTIDVLATGGPAETPSTTHRKEEPHEHSTQPQYATTTRRD